MYLPAQFEQPDIDIMHELIRSGPLGDLGNAWRNRH